MPLHHVKSHYNLILYYTSTYLERVGVSQHDNACSFILVLNKLLNLELKFQTTQKYRVNSVFLFVIFNLS
jgi:hypothetical protein